MAYLATLHADGRPLDLADVADFIATLAGTGVPATTPLLFRPPDPDDPHPLPAVSVSALVTGDQAATLPDHIDISEAPESAALQEV